jgi:precorrin-6B methylase 1
MQKMHELSEGEGRTQVTLHSYYLGNDLVVCIFNDNAHLGAVAVGEYDHESNRASVSLITRLGHKDDSIAQKAAYLISKSTKRPVCVVAGVHLDKITEEEIAQILANSNKLVERLCSTLRYSDC